MWPGLRDACLIALLTAATIAGPAAAADDTVAHGEYMTRAADCMPCHTQPGGTPFAGGLQIGTPFGSLSSPNITPDPDTGIGRWSDDDFDRALHEGLGHSGEYLYPVMPYPSYTKMTREDVPRDQGLSVHVEARVRAARAERDGFSLQHPRRLVHLARALLPSGRLRVQAGPLGRVEPWRLSGRGSRTLRCLSLAAEPHGRDRGEREPRRRRGAGLARAQYFVRSARRDRRQVIARYRHVSALGG